MRYDADGSERGTDMRISDVDEARSAAEFEYGQRFASEHAAELAGRKITNLAERREQLDPLAAGDLLDRLQATGYTPHDSGAEWFDRCWPLNGGRTVRVELDDTDVVVHGFDRHMVAEWSTRVPFGAPASMAWAVLAVAELWAADGARA